MHPDDERILSTMTRGKCILMISASCREGDKGMHEGLHQGLHEGCMISCFRPCTNEGSLIRCVRACTKACIKTA